MDGSIERIATWLLTTATRSRLYGRGHRLTVEAADQLERGLERLTTMEGPVRLTLAGDEVMFAGERIDPAAGPAYALVRRLGAKGVGRLEILPGVGRGELEELCVELGDPNARSLRSRPHIKLGTVALREPGTDDGTAILRVLAPLGQRDTSISDEAQQVAEMEARLAASYEVRTRDVRDIVLSLLSNVTCQESLFVTLAELKGHHLFTYLHTTNVVALVIGFALDLGARGREVFDLGAAALLHDVGKSFVPRDILDKPGPLDEDEWAVIRRHPVQGARFLLQQPDVNHLAVTVAYEHHMRHDGEGGYPEAMFRPCLQSQLVAIVDTFDALFGKRSYHSRYDVMDALEILHVDRGTLYSPQLVDEFTRFINRDLEGLGSAFESDEAAGVTL